MSDHTMAIVPVEAWAYGSPALRYSGRSVDIGLFAEALIYYDCVAINLANHLQLADFLTWFIKQKRFDDFLALVNEGSIKLYDYAFATAHVYHADTDTYQLWNIQDEIQAQPDSFEQVFLRKDEIRQLLPKSRQREKLYRALRDNVIEVKAEAFSEGLENARQDHRDPRRVALIVQGFVDNLYSFRNLGRPPRIEASVETSADGVNRRITWNVDFKHLTSLAGAELNFTHATPLTAGAISNRLLWSAAEMNCDLYLASPMSTLVGDKLYEAPQKVAKAGIVIEELKAQVEFPDIKQLVNDGSLNLEEILIIRKKAKKFRDWLQSEAERDRDTIIAYHNEVGKELRLISAGRSTLNMLGVLGSPALGSIIGATVSGSAGAALGGAVGSGAGYLLSLASKLGADWKPIVFGDWLSEHIKMLVKDE